MSEVSRTSKISQAPYQIRRAGSSVVLMEPSHHTGHQESDIKTHRARPTMWVFKIILTRSSCHTATITLLFKSSICSTTGSIATTRAQAVSSSGSSWVPNWVISVVTIARAASAAPVLIVPDWASVAGTVPTQGTFPDIWSAGSSAWRYFWLSQLWFPWRTANFFLFLVRMDWTL